MRNSRATYILEGTASVVTHLERILPGFALEVGPAVHRSSSYLDTFDWRFYESAREVSVESGRRTSVLSMRKRGLRQELMKVTCKRTPVFAGDLPKGPFRDEIRSIAGVRALLPVVRLSYDERLVRVLNVDQKTVSRLWVLSRVRALRDVGSRPRRLPDVIEVTPVLGYEKQARTLCAALEQAGLKEVGEDLLDLSLSAVGREPLDYSSRPRIILDPGMTLDEALRTVLIHLTRAMRANEHGMVEDIDIEFLHDFRVANRRTRSVISQFKKGISPQVLRTFRPGFKWLGKITGPTRDADVYLDQVDGYRASLPEEVAEQLLPLRAFLHEKRAREFKDMERSLKTKRYRQLLSRWESLLLGTGPNASGRLHRPIPVLPAVSARIWKVYRTIMKQGSAINSTTPATALHNLRLVCKNLRYLLEIFRSLYRTKAIDMLISELKSLQNNLGDIQDLEIQRLALDGFAGQMLEEGPVASGTVMAMGRLAAGLEERQHLARDEFADRFARFARRKNRQAFQELFRDQR